MDKLKALTLIDEEIEDDLLNGIGISKEMAQAIDAIIKSARKNIQTRFGCDYKNSTRNLSYVVAKMTKPVLDKIFVTSGESASMLLESINDHSKSNDIDNAERVLQTLFALVNIDDRRALELLYNSLILLRNYFSPDTNKVKKSKDKPYCEFCYRDARPKFDSCEYHGGLGRVDGKKTLKRYQGLRTELKEIRRTENISYDFILAKLKSAGLEDWDYESDSYEWIKILITNLRASSSNPENIIELTNVLINSPQYPIGHNNWPSLVEGTLLRYEVCQLMHYKPPQKGSNKKNLNHLWSGNSVTKSAKDLNVNEETLKRLKSLWSKKVKEMRTAGIADSIIKVVLDLEVLPKK